MLVREFLQTDVFITNTHNIFDNALLNSRMKTLYGNLSLAYDTVADTQDAAQSVVDCNLNLWQKLFAFAADFDPYEISATRETVTENNNENTSDSYTKQNTGTVQNTGTTNGTTQNTITGEGTATTENTAEGTQTGTNANTRSAFNATMLRPYDSTSTQQTNNNSVNGEVTNNSTTTENGTTTGTNNNTTTNDLSETNTGTGTKNGTHSLTRAVTVEGINTEWDNKFTRIYDRLATVIKDNVCIGVY